MSRHESLVRLRHRLDHAREAVTMAAGKTRKDVETDRKLNLALVRWSWPVPSSADTIILTRYVTSGVGDHKREHPSHYDLTKAVLSYVVGKRNTDNTEALALDLRARIVNRPQITSDGYTPYPNAVALAFQTDVDYAVLTKKYVGDSNLPDAAHRYSPGHVAGVERTVIRGMPNPEKISTSYVERFNLSSRMQMRRCTRLTNAYSKKLENHRAAVALWIAFYNLCRVHETLRCTPAKAL